MTTRFVNTEINFLKDKVQADTVVEKLRLLDPAKARVMQTKLEQALNQRLEREAKLAESDLQQAELKAKKLADQAAKTAAAAAKKAQKQTESEKRAHDADQDLSEADNGSAPNLFAVDESSPTCDYCKRQFKSRRGLTQHSTVCKKRGEPPSPSSQPSKRAKVGELSADAVNEKAEDAW